MEDKVRHDTLIGIEIAYRICLLSFIISYRKKCIFIKTGSASKAGLLNKGSCLTRALGVIKFKIVTDMIWVTLCCAT